MQIMNPEMILIHGQMQDASERPTGDWKLAMTAATVELAALTAALYFELPLKRRQLIIDMGAALLSGVRRLDAGTDDDHG